jgi:hypothetical protein
MWILWNNTLTSRQQYRGSTGAAGLLVRVGGCGGGGTRRGGAGDGERAGGQDDAVGC